MGTSRSVVRQAFYDRIENDTTFFRYYDLADDEAMEVANERTNVYIKESVAILKRNCECDISFSINEEEDEFVDDLTDDEVDLLKEICFEVFIGRDVTKLKTRVNTFSSSDLKALHSPANERNSFMSMFKDIQYQNTVRISDYAAKDRITGKYKSVN